MCMLMICKWTLLSLLRWCCNWLTAVWWPAIIFDSTLWRLMSYCLGLTATVWCQNIYMILLCLLIVNWQWLITIASTNSFWSDITLTVDTAHSLVGAFVHSRLDYCNGLLSWLPVGLMARLQSVLHAAARLVLHLPVLLSTVMRDSHLQAVSYDIQVSAQYDTHLLVFFMRVTVYTHAWLSPTSCVLWHTSVCTIWHPSTCLLYACYCLQSCVTLTYKLCLMTYKCLHNMTPIYLSSSCVLLSTVMHDSHLQAVSYDIQVSAQYDTHLLVFFMRVTVYSHAWLSPTSCVLWHTSVCTIWHPSTCLLYACYWPLQQADTHSAHTNINTWSTGVTHQERHHGTVRLPATLHDTELSTDCFSQLLKQFLFCWLALVATPAIVTV